MKRSNISDDLNSKKPYGLHGLNKNNSALNNTLCFCYAGAHAEIFVVGRKRDDGSLSIFLRMS